MGLNKFPVSGGVISDATTRVNDNNGVVLRQCGLGLIRQLEDRSVTFSADGGEWAESYTDVNGRLNSVNIANTFAFYQTGKYPKLRLGGKHQAGQAGDSYDSAFDFNKGTNTEYSVTSTASTLRTMSYGFIFSEATLVEDVEIKASVRTIGGNAPGAIYIDTYDGSTWTLYDTLASHAGDNTSTYDSVYSLDETCTGVRVRVEGQNNTGLSRLVELKVFYITAYNDAHELITHDIPSGSFSSTISSCVGIPKLVDWESGSDIQYKLTNATEDTGWLNTNEINSFTAFTSEPTKCIVKLIPKSTSPTAGYPSISGFSILGDTK
jgi:hypothetical protein